ncbi:MAG: hypothetical protein LPH21_10890 [Shewanella sp.]|nr:hypothetical protein [Shewanella sp.]
MKKMTNLILLSTSLLFNQAYASNCGGCGTLHLLVAKSIYQNFKTNSNGPIFNHGNFKGCEMVDSDTGECTHFIFEQKAFAYGPDIDIEFIERNSNKTALINIQQNYCFLEAGKITVKTRENGYFKFDYRIVTGSRAGQLPGRVIITSIEAIN